MAIVVKNTNYNGEVLERILTVATTGNELVDKGLIMVIPVIKNVTFNDKGEFYKSGTYTFSTDDSKRGTWKPADNATAYSLDLNKVMKKILLKLQVQKIKAEAVIIKKEKLALN